MKESSPTTFENSFDDARRLRLTHNEWLRYRLSGDLPKEKQDELKRVEEAQKAHTRKENKSEHIEISLPEPDCSDEDWLKFEFSFIDRFTNLRTNEEKLLYLENIKDIASNIRYVKYGNRSESFASITAYLIDKEDLIANLDFLFSKNREIAKETIENLYANFNQLFRSAKISPDAFIGNFQKYTQYLLKSIDSEGFSEPDILDQALFVLSKFVEIGESSNNSENDNNKDTTEKKLNEILISILKKKNEITSYHPTHFQLTAILYDLRRSFKNYRGIFKDKQQEIKSFLDHIFRKKIIEMIRDDALEDEIRNWEVLLYTED